MSLVEPRHLAVNVLGEGQRASDRFAYVRGDRFAVGR
jgi:hypothetical protein